MTKKEKAESAKSEKEPVTTSQSDLPSQNGSQSFPVAGIGASAGGLEALEEFFRHVPENSGIAFVVIQHLDPKHKGMMPELLRRTTGMKVVQVEDCMRLKPDCVYVIPPNKDMSVLHGVLHLFDPTTHQGLRLPIDFFLRSLADDQQERSVGIILSGMGSDGTMGLRAIKENSGLVMVQDPASAKFGSMPQSVLDAGLADIVAPVEELPDRLIAYIRHAPVITNRTPVLEKKELSSLEKVMILLRTKTGHDFSHYKKNTIHRRIERRMGIHQIGRIADYVRYLRENSQEVDLLFKELLIGVTNFFRDREEWERLGQEVVPRLLADRPSGGLIRAWSAGCSTGEEAYSLAIIFKEALAKLKPKQNYTLQIFATDLDQDAIDRARQGFYPPNITADVSSERLGKYFIKEEDGYQIGKEIREMVIFATQNLIMDPPFTKLDVLVCRNLLIYLEPELQKKLLPMFHYSLNPNGILFLGSAETVSTFTDLFSPLDAKSRLFRRRPSVLHAEAIAFPVTVAPSLPGTPTETKTSKPSVNLQALADQFLLRGFAPPAVLVNEQGDILYISGRTGNYLEPAAGKANWNIFAMAREGLRFELTGAFQKALREKETVTVGEIKVDVNGGTKTVNLTVQPVEHPEELRGMVMVIFHDVPLSATKKKSLTAKTGPVTRARIMELETEISQCRGELQATREEMQTSQEELKSMNEELQSTNEELQSSNEELTTSKEELQSMNEELHTVNAEQMSKMDDLARINSDMNNLLNSTEIITIFLDSELRIRRFTTGAKQLFKLIEVDVGRQLTDIANNLSYPELIEDIQKVIQTLVFLEKEVATADQRWFRVRIIPYRTFENMIEGVLMTFVDITSAKKLELGLCETENLLRTIVQTASVILICLSTNGQILEFNPEAERRLGRTREEILGGNYFELFLSEPERSRLTAAMKKLIASPSKTFTSRMEAVDGVLLSVHWSVKQMLDNEGRDTRVIVIGQNGARDGS